MTAAYARAETQAQGGLPCVRRSWPRRPRRRPLFVVRAGGVVSESTVYGWSMGPFWTFRCRSRPGQVVGWPRCGPITARPRDGRRRRGRRTRSVAGGGGGHRGSRWGTWSSSVSISRRGVAGSCRRGGGVSSPPTTARGCCRCRGPISARRTRARRPVGSSRIVAVLCRNRLASRRSRPRSGTRQDTAAGFGPTGADAAIREATRGCPPGAGHHMGPSSDLSHRPLVLVITHAGIVTSP